MRTVFRSDPPLAASWSATNHRGMCSKNFQAFYFYLRSEMPQIPNYDVSAIAPQQDKSLLISNNFSYLPRPSLWSCLLWMWIEIGVQQPTSSK